MNSHYERKTAQISLSKFLLVLNGRHTAHDKVCGIFRVTGPRFLERKSFGDALRPTFLDCRGLGHRSDRLTPSPAEVLYWWTTQTSPHLFEHLVASFALIYPNDGNPNEAKLLEMIQPTSSWSFYWPSTRNNPGAEFCHLSVKPAVSPFCVSRHLL